MNNKKMRLEDYPLSKKKKDLIFTPTGVKLEEITFENIKRKRVSSSDCRTSKQSLLYQADIAEADGNKNLADNFRRAAEMVDIDSERLIEIYNALRPYRSSESELREMIQELRERHGAEKTADFVEEALRILKERKKLKGDR